MKSFFIGELLFYLLFACLGFFNFHSKVYIEGDYLTNLWTKDPRNLSRSSVNTSITKFPKFDRTFYKYGNRLFYYNLIGDVTFPMTFDNNTLVTLSEKSFIVYPKAGEQITLYSRTGYKEWVFDTYSYPYLSSSGNRFVLLATDNTSISLYDLNKNLLYQNKYLGSIITDIQFCPFNDDLVAGTIEGVLLYIDFTGRERFKTTLGQSKYNLVKSVAISPDARFVSALHGVQPEYLSLYDRDGKLIWRKETGFSRRTRISMHIDTVNNIYFEPQNKSLLVRDLKNGKVLYQLDLDSLKFNEIFYIKYSSISGLIAISISTDKESYVMLVRNDGYVMWKNVLTDKDIIYCELNEKEEALLVQSSRQVTVYQLNNYFPKK